MNVIPRFIPFTIVMVALALVSGCSAEPEIYGEPITLKQSTSIKGILAAAQDFDEKTVLLKGKISDECPSGCWLVVNDGTGEIFVDTASGANFAIPQYVGKQIAVQGEVDVKVNGQPYLLGTGVEIR